MSVLSYLTPAPLHPWSLPAFCAPWQPVVLRRHSGKTSHVKSVNWRQIWGTLTRRSVARVCAIRTWGAYTRHLDPDVHSPGKRNTQKIERKHLTLRTRIKRLVRKTICFSKTTQMHDIVIGLFVNRYAFGRAL